MAYFDKEFDKLILAEGRYVNDPDDAGGETYLGISRKANPTWNGWVAIDYVKHNFGTFGIGNRLKRDTELTKKAKQLYKEKYWDVLDLDNVDNQKVAHELFDTAVNCGINTAIRIAQQTLELKVDGKITDEFKDTIKKMK